MSARSTPNGPAAQGSEPAFKESFTAFCKGKGEEPRMGLEVGGTQIKAETLYQLVSQQRPVNNRKATVFWEGIATTLLGSKPSSRNFGTQLEFFYKKQLADYAKHMASLRAPGQPSADGAMPSSATVEEAPAEGAPAEQLSPPEPQGATDGGTVAQETVPVAEGTTLPDDKGARGPPPRRSGRTTKGRRLPRPGSAKGGGDGTRARSQGRASASSESDSEGESGDTQAGAPRAFQHSPGLGPQRGWPRLRIKMDDPRYKWRNLTELHHGAELHQGPEVQAGAGAKKRGWPKAAASNRSAANSPVRKLAPTSPGQRSMASNLLRKPTGNSPALKTMAGNPGGKSRPNSPGRKSRKTTPTRKPRPNTPAPFAVAVDEGIQEGGERPAKVQRVEMTPPLLPTAGLEPKPLAPGRRSRPSSRAPSRPSSRGVSPVEGLVTAAPVPERGPTPPIRSQLHKSKSAADVPRSAATTPLSTSPVRRSGRVSLSPVRLRTDVSPSKLPARKNGATAFPDVTQATQQGPTPSARFPPSGSGAAPLDSEMPDATAAGAAEKPVGLPRPVPSAKPPRAGGKGGGDATREGDGAVAGVTSAAFAASVGAAHGGGFPSLELPTGSVRGLESGQATARSEAGQPVGLPALPTLPQRQGAQGGVSPSPPRVPRGRPRGTPPLAGPSPAQVVAPQGPPLPAPYDPFPVDTIASVVARVKEIGTTGGEMEVPPALDTLKRLKNMGKRRRDLERPRDATGDVKADEERIRRSGRARTTVSLFTPSHRDERLKTGGAAHRRLNTQALAPIPAPVAADGAGEEGPGSEDEEFEAEECREGGEYQAELPEYRDRPAEPTVEERAWCNGAGWVLKAGGLGRGPDQLAPILALRANKDPPTHFRVANGQVLSDNIVKELGLDRMGASCRKGWTVNEEKAFEEGLYKHYKQFAEVQRNLLPTKSHKDIVEYYYNVWKTQATARAKAYEKTKRRKKAASRAAYARSLREGRPGGEAEAGAGEDEADPDHLPSPSSESDGDEDAEEAAKVKRRLATEAQARRRRKRKEEEQAAKAAAGGAAALAGGGGAIAAPASLAQGVPAGMPGGRGGRGEPRPAIFPAAGSLNLPQTYMPGYGRGGAMSGPVGGRGGPGASTGGMTPQVGRGSIPSQVPGMSTSAPFHATVPQPGNMGRGGPQAPQSNNPNALSFGPMGPMGPIPPGGRGFTYPAYNVHMAHPVGSMALLGLPYASASRPPSTSHPPQAQQTWVPQNQGYYVQRPLPIGPPGPPGQHPPQYAARPPGPPGPPGQYPLQYISRPPAPQLSQPPGSAPPPVMTYPPPGYQARAPSPGGAYPRPTTLLSTVPMFGSAIPMPPAQMLPQQQSRVPKLPIAAPKRNMWSTVPRLPIARPTGPADASNSRPQQFAPSLGGGAPPSTPHYAPSQGTGGPNPNPPADASNPRPQQFTPSLGGGAPPSNPHYAPSQGNGGPNPNLPGAPSLGFGPAMGGAPVAANACPAYPGGVQPAVQQGAMERQAGVPQSNPTYMASGSAPRHLALDQSAVLRAKAAQTIQQQVQMMPGPSATVAPGGPPPSGPPHSTGGQPFQGTPAGPAVAAYTYGSAPWGGVDQSAVLRAKAAQTIQQHVQAMPAPSAAVSPPAPPPSGPPSGPGGQPFQNIPSGVGGYASGSAPQSGGGVAPGPAPVPPGDGLLGGVIFPDISKDRA